MKYEFDRTFNLMECDIEYIEENTGMPHDYMIGIVRKKWDYLIISLAVNDIVYENGRPSKFRQIRFDNMEERYKPDFVEFMADLSLTHRILFLDKDGGVFVTKSEDGTTNIDADLIEAMANGAYDR